MNKRTAREYYLRLLGFQEFVNNRYGTKNQTEVTLDDIIANIKEDSEDVYEILSDFVSHLQTKYDISALTLKQKVVTVKNFFEYCDVDVSPRKFKLKVKLPKVIRKNKQALSKEDIIDILNVELEGYVIKTNKLVKQSQKLERQSKKNLTFYLQYIKIQEHQFQITYT